MHPGPISMQVIPSSNKKQQWKEFSCLMDRLASKKRPAGQELRFLHYIFSSDADLSVFHRQKDDLIQLMHFMDLPSEMFSEFTPMMEHSSPFKMSMISLCMVDHARDKLGVEIEFAPSVRGRLRTYGRRCVNGEWNEVFASPAVVFKADSQEEQTRIMDLKAYYPPTINLRTLWNSLSEKYETLISNSANFEQKLLTESFLALIGTRALQPFIDGNGRTFMAHLALMLKKEGIVLQEFERVDMLSQSLSFIHDDFVVELLRNSNLDLISGTGHARMVFDCKFREEYMNGLSIALENAISAGIDSGPYHGHLIRMRDKIAESL